MGREHPLLGEAVLASVSLSRVTGSCVYPHCLATHSLFTRCLNSPEPDSTRHAPLHSRLPIHLQLSQQNGAPRYCLHSRHRVLLVSNAAPLEHPQSLSPRSRFDIAVGPPEHVTAIQQNCSAFFFFDRMIVAPRATVTYCKPPRRDGRHLCPCRHLQHSPTSSIPFVYRGFRGS